MPCNVGRCPSRRLHGSVQGCPSASMHPLSRCTNRDTRAIGKQNPDSKRINPLASNLCVCTAVACSVDGTAARTRQLIATFAPGARYHPCEATRATTMPVRFSDALILFVLLRRFVCKRAWSAMQSLSADSTCCTSVPPCPANVVS
jgi:hypothetical protein